MFYVFIVITLWIIRLFWAYNDNGQNSEIIFTMKGARQESYHEAR